MPRKGSWEYLDPYEQWLLAAWEPPRRHSYERHPDRYAAEHAQKGCRVWKRGVGVIVGGFVVSPAQRLIDEEDT